MHNNISVSEKEKISYLDSSNAHIIAVEPNYLSIPTTLIQMAEKKCRDKVSSHQTDSPFIRARTEGRSCNSRTTASDVYLPPFGPLTNVLV